MTKTTRIGLPVHLVALVALGLCIGADCDSGSSGRIVAGAGSNVNAGPDRTVNVGDTVTLMGTSTGVATHKWELMSRPAGSSAVIADERSLTGASFVADREGVYVAELIGAVSNDPTAPDVNPAATDTVTITAVPVGACDSLGSRLVIVLDWTDPNAELDLGGETPQVNEPSNDFGAGPRVPEMDPQCTHGGDEPIANGLMREQVICEPLSAPMRTYSGEWTIRVDNFGSEEQTFDLLVTMDGSDVLGFPLTDTVEGNGGFLDIMFCLQ